MTTIERDIYIDASPEAVDEVALNPTLLPEWYAGIEKADPDGVYPQPGGKVKLTYRAAGVNFDVTATSLDLVPSDHFDYHMDGMISGDAHWTHKRENGGVRITCRLDYELKRGKMGEVFDKIAVERINTQHLEKSLSNLKVMVESRN